MLSQTAALHARVVGVAAVLILAVEKSFERYRLTHITKFGDTKLNSTKFFRRVPVHSLTQNYQLASRFKREPHSIHRSRFMLDQDLGKVVRVSQRTVSGAIDAQPIEARLNI
jgi:hypothetical protein